MALSNDIQALPMPGWPGGLNKESDQAQVELTETPDAMNVNFGVSGSVSRRSGYTSLSTGIASKTGGHVHAWRDKLLIVTAEGDVLTVSGTTTTDSTLDLGTGPFTGTQYNVGMASLNDSLYATRQDAVTPVKWDGTTVSAVTATAFDGTAARFPRARTICAQHERIFAGNVRTAAGTEYKSRLYWSDALTPETWAALSYIEVDPDDGSEITALQPFGDSILVFKTNSVFLLSGVDEASFTLYPIDPEVGTTAPGTVVVDGGRVIFLDPRRGVMLFDGSGFTRISEKINTFVLEGMNRAKLETCSAFMFEGRYYLSVPWGTDTEPSRTFVFDEINGAWTQYDYGFTSASLDDLDIRGRIGGQIDTFTLEDGNTDDGANISAYFKTSWFSPAGIANLHRLRRMDFAFSVDTLSTVTCKLTRDYKRDPYATQVITADPGGSLWNTMDWGDAWGTGFLEALTRTSGWGSKRWRTAQLEFSFTDAVELSQLTMELSVHWRVRGEN